MISNVRPAFIGQRERTAATAFFCPYQSLILQLLQGRVDRARAGLPGTAAALGDLLDDLVPVQGALSQHGQDRRPNIAAPGLRRPPARTATEPRGTKGRLSPEDRKSTRLNSSHANISYAVFCLKKKKTQNIASSLKDKNYQEEKPIIKHR